MALTAGKTRGKVEDVHLAQIDSRKGGVGGDGTGKMTAGKTRGRVVLVGTGPERGVTHAFSTCKNSSSDNLA